MTYEEALLDHKKLAGIWGTGYIGYSTMLHLASKGVVCIGYDPDKERVAQINRGRYPVLGLDDWLDIDPQPLVAKQRMRATGDLREILDADVVVHVVAVPTEREGKPWWEALHQVINQLAKTLVGSREYCTLSPLVVIESTLAPGTTDRVILPTLAAHGLMIGRDLLLGIAPRRDWFVAPDKSLRTLDRIFCGIDEKSAEATEDFLAILCNNLHRASSYHVGELVK